MADSDRWVMLSTGQTGMLSEVLEAQPSGAHRSSKNPEETRPCRNFRRRCTP